MPFPKLWLSGPQECQRPLLEEALESPSGASESSCSSSWYFRRLNTGCSKDRSSASLSLGNRLDSESADTEPRSIPAGLSLFDPVRFGPSSRPSEELLSLAAVFAKDRTQYEKDVQEHEQLVGLLSRQDWKLLRWSDRRLVKLAAQEGLGPAAFDEATSSPELKLLLRQRQRAWVLAHQIVKQWNSLVVHRAFLETSFFHLWPTRNIQEHWNFYLDSSPDHESNEAYVDALGKVPDAPEFHVLYQDLPDWVKAAAAGSAKPARRSTHSLQ